MAIKKMGSLEIEEEAARIKSQSIVKFIARAGLFIFLIFAFLGFTGDGYFATKTMQTSDKLVSVKYQRFGRINLVQALQITLIPENRASQIVLWFSNDYIQSNYIRQILPAPVQSIISNNRIYYTFDVSNNSSPITVSFQLEPQKRGTISAKMGVKDTANIYFSQFIFP